MKKYFILSFFTVGFINPLFLSAQTVQPTQPPPPAPAQPAAPAAQPAPAPVAAAPIPPTPPPASGAAGTAAKNSGVDYGTYKWTSSIPMAKSDINGNDLKDADPKIVESIIDQRFVIYNTLENGDVVIKIVSYEDDYHFYAYNYNGTPKSYYDEYQSDDELNKGPLKGSDKQAENKTIRDANKSKKVDHGNYGSKQIYFRIKSSDILKYAIKANIVKGGLAFGIINFPLKFRPQANRQDFNSAFNLNAAVGYSLPRKAESDWQQSFVVGIGMSFISLDTSVVEKYDNKSKLEAGNSYSAVTFSAGYLLQYQKVQVGLFVGVDRLTNLYQQQFDWKYQGNAWFSLGLGYSIFVPQKPESAPTGEQ